MRWVEALIHSWEHLLDLSTGPLSFRFILQPLVAIVIAIRAGVKDARTFRPPYLVGLFSLPSERRALIRSTMKDLGRLYIVAVAMDCVYQVIALRWIYPLQALVVGFLLAVIPYALIRGLANRIASRLARREWSSGKAHPRIAKKEV